jgi:hypothetical protein
MHRGGGGARKEIKIEGVNPPPPPAGRFRYVILSTLPRLEIASGKKGEIMLGDIVQNIKPVFFLLFSAPAVSHSSQK